MVKKTYRVRNWHYYNKALVKRGSVTLWLEQASLAQWYEFTPTGERGRPKKYSDKAVELLLTLRQVFHLPLRQCQGFVKSLFELMKVRLDVMDYSRLSRRQSGVKLPSLPVKSLPIHLVIDASGLKVYGEGEWKVRRHGYSKHRTWRKLHIG
ncbi:MAG: IS5 family transposase [Pseudomonadota bacterium]